MRRLAALLCLLMLTLGACGGDDDSDGVEDLLNRAFQQEIESADLEIEAELDLDGGTSTRPVRIEASGPFRTNDGKLPSVDIDLRVGVDGGGQTIQTGFLSTGDRAFVKFQDVYYEQPAAEVRRANRSLAKNRKRRGSLRALGLDPRSWLGQAEDEGEDEVGGVQTRHVSGTLDVEAVMHDLNSFVRRSASAIGGATGQDVPEPLSAKDIQEIGDVVRDPSFHVYVSKEDSTIRRVSGRVEFVIPEESRSSGDIEGGSLTFSVELKEVNGDQEIEAPANARPLSALTDSLGSDALGLGGGGAGTTPVVPADPDPPNAGIPDSGGDDSTEAEAFRAYAECLDKARPEDTDALQECADLLERP